MSTYTITITNNSAHVRTYRLLVEVPPVAAGTDEVWSNVYAFGYPTYNDGGIQTFTVSERSFAVCGYQEILNCAVISGNDNVEIFLEENGKDVTTMTVGQGFPHFSDPTTGGDSGSFKINVLEYDAKTYRDIFCGYGKLRPAGDSTTDVALGRVPGVRLVACWKARPSTEYTVTPVAKYYVCSGDFFKPGGAVRVSEIGVKQEIDFTGRKERCASVEHLADGSYGEVTYSDSPPA